MASLRKGTRFNVRDVLISLQVAICLIALVGAGLFLLSLRNARQMDPGFDTNNLAMLSFDLGALNYDTARGREFERRALEAAQNAPGIRTAALSNTIPLFNGGFGRTLFREGEDSNNGQSGHVAQISEISPEYFKTMGIPLLRGENFDSTVRENSPRVTIINETAAKQIWPNEDPIGKRFKFFKDTEFTKVIGIARDSKYNTLGEEARPYMYVPLIQTNETAVTIFFRTQGDPRSALSTVRTEVQAMDSQPADHECLAYRGSDFTIAVGIQLWRKSAGCVCHDCHGALRGGNLWRCGIFRGPAHSRVWHPAGLGRPTKRRAHDGAEAKRRDHGSGAWVRTSCRVLARTPDCYVLVWREYQLTARVPCHGVGAGGCRSFCQLHPCAPSSHG